MLNIFSGKALHVVHSVHFSWKRNDREVALMSARPSLNELSV